ncbi:MAG TPA: putative toxin-antitoxin system toxin component, PIN family [Tepidisphaeraceae bacterium]|nr:putative toxin-antitoxin system toxin component, PIN family [Tepidisphaeraceae bacterium]
MKIVFDTNVLLSVLFTRGVCEALLDACLDNETHALFVSEIILSEFEEHATKQFHVPPEKVRRAIALFREHMTIVPPSKVAKDACRDANDLAILGTLLAAGADVLVTGDKDLLSLQQFDGRPIITPRHCFDLLNRPV